VVKFQIKTIFDFLQSDADILTTLEKICTLCEWSFSVISIKNFFNLFFSLIFLWILLIFRKLFKNVFIHSCNKQRFQVITESSLRVIFWTIVGFHFLLGFINQTFKIILSVDILTILSVRIYQFDILSLPFKLLNFLFLLLESFISMCLLLIINILLLITFNFDSLKKLELIFSLSEFVVDRFFERLHASHDFDSLFKFPFFLVLHFSELNILLRNCNVSWSMVKVHSSKIACWCIDDSFLLIESSSFSFNWSRWWFQFITFIFLLIFMILVFNIAFSYLFSILLSILPFILRTWIVNGFDFFNHIISYTNDMDFSIDSVTASSDITIERDINLIVFCVSLVFIGLPSVSQNEWVVGSPWNLWTFTWTNMTCDFGCLYFFIESFIEFT